jgi:hypothetical protein
MNPRWNAVASLSQALLCAIFVFNYVEGDATLLITVIGSIASITGAVMAALAYRREQRGESAWRVAQ